MSAGAGPGVGVASGDLGACDGLGRLCRLPKACLPSRGGGVGGFPGFVGHGTPPPGRSSASPPVQPLLSTGTGGQASRCPSPYLGAPVPAGVGGCGRMEERPPAGGLAPEAVDRSAPLPISHLRGLGSPSPPGLLAERWGVGTLEGHRERVAGLCPPPDRHATSSSVGSWAQVVALCCGSPPPPPGLSSPLLEGLPGVCLLPSPAPPSRCSQESPNPGKSRWA